MKTDSFVSRRVSIQPVRISANSEKAENNEKSLSHAPTIFDVNGIADSSCLRQEVKVLDGF